MGISKARSTGYKQLLKALHEEKVETWFDIGLLLDRLKEDQKPFELPSTYDRFRKGVAKGIGFVAFDFGIDGVSIEVSKYAKAFTKLLEKESNITPKFSCIGGHFSKATDTIFSDEWSRHVLREARGFDDWDGYNEYFHTSLSRGSKEYIELAKKIWSGAQRLSLEIADIVLQKDISLLFPVNVNSNPGNVSLALALVMVSEYMDVPVLASHHDFYWEDGKRPHDKKAGEKDGLRDHFFKNCHIGEVQSLIDMLYPWNSNRWFHTVINARQKEILINNYGLSPASINRIPTAIDLSVYKSRTDEERKDIFHKLKLIFSGGEDKLQSRSIFDLPENCANIKESGKAFFFGAESGTESHFSHSNILLVQPTRIIKRKRIELDYKFIEGLLKNKKFSNYFKTHKQLTITLLITGPVATGHDRYFNQIVKEFKDFLSRLPDEFKNRVFLAPAFGLENQKVLDEMGLGSLTIEELYSVASMVMLPSQTEGRGLPIIESSAVKVPIMCHRYDPEYVYADVIGEGLEEERRLRVLEFKGDTFPDEMISSAAELFMDPEVNSEFVSHNRGVLKKRYSMSVLVNSIDKSLYGLWSVARPDPKVSSAVQDAFRIHKDGTNYGKKFHSLVLNENRKYIPGMTQLEFMIYLKSLIDPSFFRLEEMELKSRIYDFSERLLYLYLSNKNKSAGEKSDKILFYKMIEKIFTYYRGTDPLAIDHSYSYRHRNRRHYPYRKITEQELYGIVGILFRKIFPNDLTLSITSGPVGNFFDLRSSILQFAQKKGNALVIDDSDRLLGDLVSQKNFAVFPGHFFEHELRVFVLNVMKERLGLSLDHMLTAKDLTSDRIEGVGSVTFFARKKPLNDISYDMMVKWLKTSATSEIKLLYKNGLFKIIAAENLARGIHLGQMGKEAIDELLTIKKNNGFIVASSNSSFMLDMINLPCYHIGQVKTPLLSNFMGLNMDDCYLQWVPAGLKPSLAYPTPVQTPKEFSQVFKSELFDDCIRKFGEEKVLAKLSEDADKFGNPIKVVLNNMMRSEGKEGTPIFSSTINGIHEDDLPWSGAMVKVPMQRMSVKYNIALSGHSAKPVVELINNFESKSGKKVAFGWNGGYILNNELVGKLGLPEDYIGSPLGFVCANKGITALPLYNKAAILIDDQGKISMDRINLKKGLSIEFSGGKKIELDGAQLNLEKGSGAIYYDLMYPREKSYCFKDRVIYRFAGNKVIDVIKAPTEVNVIPVGLLLSVPVDEAFDVEVGSEVKYTVAGLEHIVDAIEAGPMLVDKSKEAIDMLTEGWKTENSIATQAARLDFIDMRGPKMAAGLTNEGELILIAINGRIRESVGATHVDAAEILIKQGCVKGMGFDPGGSVTLVVDGKQLNISPYNKDYESNIYSLPPQARFVGNAILGTIE